MREERKLDMMRRLVAASAACDLLQALEDSLRPSHQHFRCQLCAYVAMSIRDRDGCHPSEEGAAMEMIGHLRTAHPDEFCPTTREERNALAATMIGLMECTTIHPN